jgi:hypothetical protein
MAWDKVTGDCMTERDDAWLDDNSVIKKKNNFASTGEIEIKSNLMTLDILNRG